MSDFTAHWHWPQWALLFSLFVSFTLHAARHGEEKLILAGDEKGRPAKYNGFGALARFASMMFVLIAGGFFA